MRDDESTDGRARHRSSLQHDRIEADGVRQVLARHQVWNQRLSGWSIERTGGGAQRGKQIDRPHLRESAEGQCRERDRDHGHCRLRQHHQFSSVERIGHHAGQHREHHDRDDADQPHQTERQRFPIGGHKQRDMPQNRGRLHHRSGKRRELAPPEQPEVAMLERDKRRGTGRRSGGLRGRRFRRRRRGHRDRSV